MTPRADETRFDRGAWLTLTLAVVVLVAPLVITLLGATRPTDGWAHTSDPTSRYRLDLNLTDQPSPLHEGDIITAINGQRLDAEHPLDLLLTQYAPGDELTLSVLRGGRTLEVKLTLATRPAQQ